MKKKEKATFEIANKKAYHDYFVDDTLECGISLKGHEIKSIILGNCNISDSWVTIQNGQLVIRGMHVSKYDKSNAFDVDETRERVLLAHKSEIRKLTGKIKLDGITLIPLKLYFSKDCHKLKVLVGVCRGKHNYDKRESLKIKQMNKDANKALKERNRKE